jgi:hypothetical protein
MAGRWFSVRTRHRHRRRVHEALDDRLYSNTPMVVVEGGGCFP